MGQAAIRCVVVLMILLPMHGASAVEDVTFLHVSDEHVPHAFAQTQDTMAKLPIGEPIHLEPYDVTVPPAGFIIGTGDLNEFSGGNGWWEQYMSLYDGIDLPVYRQLGNHDNTWECGRPRLRELYGSAFYTFERGGVKFIGLDTATPQDPRPSIATEGLVWLEDELADTPPGQPIILFFHHPLDGREFAGDWERARLLDAIRDRNVLVLLVGHGHGARAWKVENIDMVMGGSTWGNSRGYGIVSIKDNVLRICHRHVAPEPHTKPLLEKAVVEEPPLLRVLSVEPGDGAVVDGDGEHAMWRFRVASERPIARAEWTVDDERTGSLTQEGDRWTARVDIGELVPGAHIAHFEFADAEGHTTSRTVSFWLNAGNVRIGWKRQLPGSCQSTPAAADGRLFVGSNDGSMSCFDAVSGELLWRHKTGGEVRSNPAVDEKRGRVYFASAEGTVAAMEFDGDMQWEHDAGAPIYGSAVVVDDRVICGTSSGNIIAMEAEAGTELWRNEAPEYAIETAVAVGSEVVCTGCWDRFVYCVDPEDGSLRWRNRSAGSDREGTVARYYSPADCAPAIIGERVFVTDRAYRLSVMDVDAGERLAEEERCVAVAAGPKGEFAYVRHTDHHVSKRRADGSIVWQGDVPTGAIAAPPTIADGVVWVCSNVGVLSGIDDATGKVRIAYRAFSESYVFASPAAEEGMVYVVDAAGRLLALRAGAG